MKRFRSLLICLISALLLCSLIFNLAACAGGEDPSAESTADQSALSSEGAGDSESDGAHESGSDNENGNDSDSNVSGSLPSRKPVDGLTTGSGMDFYLYDNSDETDYDNASLWFAQNGYTLYCDRDTENTRSATYVKGEEYATIFLRTTTRQLYIGQAAEGGDLLPPRSTEYRRVCETTITQPGLSGSGLCEIIRLADGSFLVVDGSSAYASETIYKELCRLNGSSTNIRISAWLLTHSHGDHYGGFKQFLNDHRRDVTVDYVLYAPITREVIDIMDSYNVSWNTIDYYFNDGLRYTMQLIPEATLVPVHGGQTFRFADVELQILFSPEYLYIEEIPVDYNNSSIVARVEGDNGGAAIFMGDNGAEASQWIRKTYSSELKSNIMQMTHHGMMTENDVQMMRAVDPSTILWPCNEDGFNMNWGTSCKGKQIAIDEVENLIHGCGSATRPLNYVGSREKGTQVPLDVTVIGSGVDILETETGITYKVTEPSNPHVQFETDISTEYFNTLRITVKCPTYTNARLYWTSGSDEPMAFTDEKSKPLGPQGAALNHMDGYVTLIVYLGNCEDFTGDISSIRIDLGNASAQTVSISEIEAYWMQLDESN